MKRRYYLFHFAITILLIELLTVNVYGNGVVVDPLSSPILGFFLLILIFFLGTSLEYIIFKYSKIRLRSEPRSLISSIFKINLVTFPLTQILAYLVFIYLLSFFWIYIFFIEILVVVMEYLLLKIEFNKRYNLQINSIGILFISIKANLGSFLIGLLLFVVPSFFYWNHTPSF